MTRRRPRPLAVPILASVLLLAATGCAARRVTVGPLGAVSARSPVDPADHLLLHSGFFRLAAIRDLQRQPPVEGCLPWHAASTHLDPSLPFVISCATPAALDGQDADAYATNLRSSALCRAMEELIRIDGPYSDPAVREVWDRANRELADRALRLDRMPTRAEVDVYAYNRFRDTDVLARIVERADRIAPRLERVPVRTLRPWETFPDLSQLPRDVALLDGEGAGEPGFLQATETYCTALFRVWNRKLIVATLDDPHLEACLEAHHRLVDPAGEAHDPGYRSLFDRTLGPIERRAARVRDDDRDGQRKVSRALYEALERSGVSRRLERAIVEQASR